MRLARFDAPFEHPDWIFEPNLDGFRAVAYVEGGACRLVSRNRKCRSWQSAYSSRPQRASGDGLFTVSTAYIIGFALGFVQTQM
jgi:hypothetical protein